MRLRVHAIVLALNEEAFIANQLSALYPFCSGISVLTQFDRDWYGKSVIPDRTAAIVTEFHDPEGKIQLVLRRFPDEAAARNSEMLALAARPHRGVMSHGSPDQRIARFHDAPDYFLIVDADEIYDSQTLPRMIDFLALRRPRGMRVHGFNYVQTWNRRVPRDVVDFYHFGFLKPGVLFEMRRTVTWNESRFAKLLGLLRLPDFSARLWGFIECPTEIGVFHHGCWLGGADRLRLKSSRSSHPEINAPSYADDVAAIPWAFVATRDLPATIRDVPWPAGFLEEPR